MKRATLLLLMFVFVAARPAVPKARFGDQPVVLELFTSYGCPTCPPADALLRRIAADPELRGKVIPLAYHVDYWDRLGWRDPFSSRTWTQRQHEYIRALKVNSAYTPQIVVNGARQMVGSSTVEIYRAVEEESQRRSEARVTLRADGGDVIVTARAPHAEVDLVIVAYEDGITTKILAGENEGRTQVEDAIVRKLLRVATLDGTKAFERRVPLPLGARMGAIALLQDGETRRILAAAAITPGSIPSR